MVINCKYLTKMNNKHSPLELYCITGELRIEVLFNPDNGSYLLNTRMPSMRPGFNQEMTLIKKIGLLIDPYHHF